jgi:hypothetical protein
VNLIGHDAVEIVVPESIDDRVDGEDSIFTIVHLDRVADGVTGRTVIDLGYGLRR